MEAVYIILAVIAAATLLYIIFIVCPAVFSFGKIFGKKKADPLEGRDISNSYFAPFEKMMRDAADRVEQTYELKRIKITAYDGADLYADYIDRQSDKTVAFFHGYVASPLVNFSVHTEYFIERGYNVLLVFQRAHGVSGGEYCTLGILERHDVQSWAQWLDKTPAENVVLYGISMGASTIAYAAPEIKSEKVKALVLDCGYTSPYIQIYRDCQKRKLPGRLLMPVINARFHHVFKKDLRMSTADALKNNKIPVLFLHGKADKTVPYTDSEINCGACGGEKKLILADGLHHTLAFSTGDDALREEVFDYIESQFITIQKEKNK